MVYAQPHAYSFVFWCFWRSQSTKRTQHTKHIALIHLGNKLMLLRRGRFSQLDARTDGITKTSLRIECCNLWRTELKQERKTE